MVDLNITNEGMQSSFSSIRKDNDEFEGDQDTIHSETSIDRRCIEDELEQLRKTLEMVKE